MTLDEFRKLRKNIEQTHPVPEWYSAQQKTRYHSKVSFMWLDEIEEMYDRATSEKEKQQIKKDFLIALGEIEAANKKYLVNFTINSLSHAKRQRKKEKPV